MEEREREFYLIGIVVDELLLVVTSVALVNDAKKFDVNCEANALISIDETLISGPTKTTLKRERVLPISYQS